MHLFPIRIVLLDVVARLGQTSGTVVGDPVFFGSKITWRYRADATSVTFTVNPGVSYVRFRSVHDKFRHCSALLVRVISDFPYRVSLLFLIGCPLIPVFFRALFLFGGILCRQNLSMWMNNTMGGNSAGIASVDTVIAALDLLSATLSVRQIVFVPHPTNFKFTLSGSLTYGAARTLSNVTLTVQRNPMAKTVNVVKPAFFFALAIDGGSSLLSAMLSTTSESTLTKMGLDQVIGPVSLLYVNALTNLSRDAAGWSLMYVRLQLGHSVIFADLVTESFWVPLAEALSV